MILIRHLAPAAIASLLVKAAEEQVASRPEPTRTPTRNGEILYFRNGQKEGRPR